MFLYSCPVHLLAQPCSKYVVCGTASTCPPASRGEWEGVSGGMLSTRNVSWSCILELFEAIPLYICKTQTWCIITGIMIALYRAKLSTIVHHSDRSPMLQCSIPVVFTCKHKIFWAHFCHCQTVLSLVEENFRHLVQCLTGFNLLWSLF